LARDAVNRGVNAVVVVIVDSRSFMAGSTLPWRPRRCWRFGRSCGFLPFFPIDIARRASVQRRVRTCLVVKAEPVADYALGGVPVGKFAQINCLVLQRTPQSLDEDIVQVATATIHGTAHPGHADAIGESDAGELRTLIRVEDLRDTAPQRRLQRLDAVTEDRSGHASC